MGFESSSAIMHAAALLASRAVREGESAVREATRNGLAVRVAAARLAGRNRGAVRLAAGEQSATRVTGIRMEPTLGADGRDERASCHHGFQTENCIEVQFPNGRTAFRPFLSRARQRCGGDTMFASFLFSRTCPSAKLACCHVTGVTRPELLVFALGICLLYTSPSPRDS